VATDDVQSPLATVVDGPNLLNVLDVCVGVGFVLAEDEVPPPVFEVAAFREADTPVLGVVLEAVLFERDRRARVLVAVLAVCWRIRVLVPVLPMAVPRVERLSEFLNNSLCSKISDFWHHERRGLSNELDCALRSA
jgi:hypothetical protein